MRLLPIVSFNKIVLNDVFTEVSFQRFSNIHRRAVAKFDHLLIHFDDSPRSEKTFCIHPWLIFKKITTSNQIRVYKRYEICRYLKLILYLF